jgi:hypothetical protein
VGRSPCRKSSTGKREAFLPENRCGRDFSSRLFRSYFDQTTPGEEKIMENVVERASRIRNSLASQGSLNLWEVRAILNETRDAAFQVLFWMASRKEIEYRLQGEELHVTLCGTVA